MTAKRVLTSLRGGVAFEATSASRRWAFATVLNTRCQFLARDRTEKLRDWVNKLGFLGANLTGLERSNPPFSDSLRPKMAAKRATKRQTECAPNAICSAARAGMLCRKFSAPRSRARPRARSAAAERRECEHFRPRIMPVDAFARSD